MTSTLSDSRFPQISGGGHSGRASAYHSLVPHTPSPSCRQQPDHQGGAPLTSPTACSNTGEVEELMQLKQMLRQQQQRLSSPAGSRTPRRPDGALVPSYHPVAGQNYASRPYHRLTPKKMWEPSFANDKDVVELADRLQRSEERIETRQREMDAQWSQRKLFSAGAPHRSAAFPVANPLTGSSSGPYSVTCNTELPPPPRFEPVPGVPPGQRPASGGLRPGSSGRQGPRRPNSRPSSGALGSVARSVADSTPTDGYVAGSAIPEQAAEELSSVPSFQVEHPDGTSEQLESSTQDMFGVAADAAGKRPSAGSRSTSAVGHLDIPAALRRRTSSVKVSSGTLAVLSMLENAADICIPAPKEVGFERSGDILSINHILKQDLFESAFTRRDLVGVMSGAPYFRMVPKFHIGGVAQAHAHGIRTAVNELRKAQPEGPILWVNLREEPIIYLNGRSHIIRSADQPLEPRIIPNISGDRIARIEEKLRLEILREAALNKGNICVHHESANGVIDEQWECVDPADIVTVEDIFRSLNAKGLGVEYRRRPLTQGVAPTPGDFQSVVELCEEFPDAPIIFNCQTGRGRSSLMMLVASIVRFYQLCTQDINADVTLLRIDGRANAYRSLQKLISLLPNGALHERRVAVLMELSDKIYSVADHINASMRAADGGAAEKKSRMRLVQYAYLLMLSCYCEQYFWSKQTSDTFSQWVEKFTEVKVLVNTITTSKNVSLVEERITSPGAIVEDEDVARHIRHRRGHVLCANMILRSAPRDVIDGPATSVPGVVALRQLAPDVPLFTCGRVSEEGRENLLYNIRIGFPQAIKPITWVSLRAEPMIFINGVSYSLVDYSAAQSVTGDMTSTMHISRERLEEIEERLANDVQMEKDQCDGLVIVHRLTADGETEVTRLNVVSVQTPRAIMESFAVDTGIRYVRIPIPYSGNLIPEDIDPIVSFFTQLYANDDDGHVTPVILNDADGALRTTIALNVATMALSARIVPNMRDVQTSAHLHRLLVLGNDAERKDFTLSTGRCYRGLEEEELLPEFHNELQVASVALQMIAAGSLLKFVDAVIDLGGAGSSWNILHAIDQVKTALGPNDKNGPAVAAALQLVRRYLLVLLTAAFVDEQRSGVTPASEKFSEWIESLHELQNILERLDEHPSKTLKYVDRRNLMATTVSDRAVERRAGNVLTANFAMKADHFPGCQKKGLRPQICGGPNFRKVPMTNIFGAAIPTIQGVHNILSVLGASEKPLVQFGNDQNDDEMWLGYATPRLFDKSFDTSLLSAPLRGRVVWVNLREEPIIYVGDRPFVFRDMQQPYVNVELTGIESHKVEHVENALKDDILREAAMYDGNFLVHDEGKPGELVGTWEPATTHTVKTVRQVYDEAAAEGCRVKFLRLPVTDEQSPELKDFDMLVSNLLPEILECRASDEPKSFVFNCQMGRGRTTTGMVVCSLLIGAVFPEYYDLLNEHYPTIFAPTDSELSKGNYTCILQLKSVLLDGRESKQKVDLVLEACNKMQNLRTAIEGFVLQMSSPDVTEEARARAMHHGVHYLQRYFDLLAFASYLAEQMDVSSGVLRMSFEDWMKGRPELGALHDSAALM